MNLFEFEAKSVVFTHPDRECHLVGFADREFETSTYLMLQRSYEFDEQDVALGTDTYHVEWCDQDNSGYGGISQFSIRPGQAEIAFDPTVAEALGMGRLAISFQLAPADYSALVEALEHIFEGSGCLLATNA